MKVKTNVKVGKDALLQVRVPAQVISTVKNFLSTRPVSR
jgi:hypothetical protein